MQITSLINQGFRFLFLPTEPPPRFFLTKRAHEFLSLRFPLRRHDSCVLVLVVEFGPILRFLIKMLHHVCDPLLLLLT